MPLSNEWNTANEIYNPMRKQGEFILIDAEFWDNIEDTMFTGNCFKIAKGDLPVRKWIKDSGLERCKKSEATALLTIGEKNMGCYVVGNYKNYWLRKRS